MADRLTIYRDALRLLGNAASLSSLTEVSASRAALDDAWRSAGDYLLEKGLWNFAIRTVEMQPDEDVDALFGYTYAYSKPTDWVRTVNISDNGRFSEGLFDYQDEADYWYTSSSPMYLRYVSDDDNYGWNVGRWRQSFAKALAAYLAYQCGLPISADRGNRNDLYNLFRTVLKDAKALDAVDEKVQQKPAGRLVRARLRAGNQKDD